MPKTLDSAALLALRALFDLADTDLRASPDLLGRLLGLDPNRCIAAVSRLRAVGLVQRDRLGLTLVGLAVAMALPVTEPCPLEVRLEQFEAA